MLALVSHKGPTARSEVTVVLARPAPHPSPSTMSTAKTLASIAAPAPEVVQEPVQQAKQLSSKQRAKIDQGLQETRVERVRVDGLVSPATFNTRTRHTRRAGAPLDGQGQRGRGGVELDAEGEATLAAPLVRSAEVWRAWKGQHASKQLAEADPRRPEP